MVPISTQTSLIIGVLITIFLIVVYIISAKRVPKNQEIVIVKDKQETAEEVARLVADGWKIIQYNAGSFLLMNSDRLANYRGVTLEKDGRQKIIRTANAPAENIAGVLFDLTRNWPIYIVTIVFIGYFLYWLIKSLLG